MNLYRRAVQAEKNQNYPEAGRLHGEAIKLQNDALKVKNGLQSK